MAHSHNAVIGFNGCVFGNDNSAAGAIVTVLGRQYAVTPFCRVSIGAVLNGKRDAGIDRKACVATVFQGIAAQIQGNVLENIGTGQALTVRFPACQGGVAQQRDRAASAALVGRINGGFYRFIVSGRFTHGKGRYVVGYCALITADIAGGIRRIVVDVRLDVRLALI